MQVTTRWKEKRNEQCEPVRSSGQYLRRMPAVEESERKSREMQPAGQRIVSFYLGFRSTDGLLLQKQRAMKRHSQITYLMYIQYVRTYVRCMQKCWRFYAVPKENNPRGGGNIKKMLSTIRGTCRG